MRRDRKKKASLLPIPVGVTVVAMMHDVTSRPKPIASVIPSARTEGGGDEDEEGGMER